MSFSFNPLWKLLIDKNMKREDLRVALGFSFSTMSKMSKGEYVSMEVIHKICEYFDIPISSVVEYVSEKK